MRACWHAHAHATWFHNKITIATIINQILRGKSEVVMMRYEIKNDISGRSYYGDAASFSLSQLATYLVSLPRRKISFISNNTSNNSLYVIIDVFGILSDHRVQGFTTKSTISLGNIPSCFLSCRRSFISYHVFYLLTHFFMLSFIYQQAPSSSHCQHACLSHRNDAISSPQQRVLQRGV